MVNHLGDSICGIENIRDKYLMLTLTQLCYAEKAEFLWENDC